MSLKTRMRVLHAALEVTYGTAVALATGNAIQTKGLEIMPLEGGTISRDLDRPTLGADLQLHVGTHVKVKFSVEMVGSGTLGTAPAWGLLLLACGMQETIVAATSVEYRPHSASTSSLTMQFNLDGQRHRLLGARGTVKARMTSQEIPMLDFEFTGLWVPPTSEAALGTGGWSAFQQPEPVNFANTTGLSFFGAAGTVMRSIELDLGNDVQHFDNPGEESVQIVDRESKGSVSVLMQALSVFNPFTTAKANTLGTIAVTHGTVAARRVVLDCASTVQLLQPKYSDDRGRAQLDCGLSLVPTSAGDDELKIRCAAA